jgi:hypothetical protein
VKRFKRGRGEFNAEDAESAEVAEKRKKEHSPFGFAQGMQELSRKRRGMGRRWLCHRDWGTWKEKRS